MTNEEYIYRWLRDHGYTHVGTCAIMGSMQSESAFIPNNVEDRCPMSDVAYTKAVDDESYSFKQFYSDAYGYGLTQTTYFTRKQKLWRLAKDMGVSVGDLDFQLTFLDVEMTEDFPGIKRLCQGKGTLEACSSAMVRQFENPADHATRLRTDLRNATALYNKYMGYDMPKEAEEEDSCDDEQLRTADVDYGDLPVTSVKSHTPIYVKLMQALMYLHGYAVEKTGEFDGATAECLRAWQEDHGLTVDAVCGPKTWQSLIEEEDV